MRTKIMKALLYSIFPILFNVIFFLAKGKYIMHIPSVWMSYAWLHLAYAFMIATPFFSRKTQSFAVFKFTTGQVTFIYFILEFILGLLFIIIHPQSFVLALVLQLILFCLFLAAFLVNLLYNEHTAESEIRQAAEVSFIKTAASKAKFMMDSVSDVKLKARIEKVYDLIHSSPTRSYASVKELESSVMMMLNELSMELDENNEEAINKLIKKIHFTMEERNRLVMLSNR